MRAYVLDSLPNLEDRMKPETETELASANTPDDTWGSFIMG